MWRLVLLLIIAVSVGAGPKSDPQQSPDPALSEMYKKDLQEEWAAQVKQRAAACRVATPPKLGMSESSVLASCWGRPDHKRFKGQQIIWGYPEGYLYFTNGLVTRIVTPR